MSSTDAARFSNFQSDPTALLLDNFKCLAIQGRLEEEVQDIQKREESVSC